MYTIDQISFKDKKALVRVDFNVPFGEDGQITDDTRIMAALSTIKHILKSGGAVILMSHLGRPKGIGFEAKYSLEPVAKYLETILEQDVKFCEECDGDKAVNAVAELKPGEVLMLENLRFHKEETEGDKDFAQKLSLLGDVYINDAFGAAHRAHASTAIIAQFFKPDVKSFGYLMAAEVKSLKKALSEGERPITAVIGGAKVSSKIDVLMNLLDKVDQILIGGGMAYTFIKAMGGHVGKSLVELDKLDIAAELMEKAKEKEVEILLPIDSVNNTSFADTKPSSITAIDNIGDNEMGLDIGIESIKSYERALLSSKTIIWNGPVGVFEFENYKNGTVAVGKAIAAATKAGAFSLVGGGDSVAAAKKFGLEDQLSYVSTGGGAMLEYLEGKELPGIAAMA